MSRAFLLLYLFSLCFPAAPSSACIHVPRTYKGVVTENTKQALLFSDGVNAHLIISTNLHAKSGSLPEAMAWVIPLPSLPSHYEEADPALFPELFRVIERAQAKRHARTKSLETADIPASSAIAVHAAQIVGSYRVQPVEIVDPKNAGGELNRWLLANGFGSVPPKNQQYYLRKGAVFLCLKITGLSGEISDIKPLHIVYKSDLLTLPLKFSTHSGTFNVELYTYTPRPVRPALLTASGLNGDESTRIGSASDAPLLWAATRGRAGYLTRFEGTGFNGTGLMVHDLKADPAIDLRRGYSPPKAASALPPAGLLGLAASAITVLGVMWQRRALKRLPKS